MNLATKTAAMEAHESIFYKKITMSLIEFYKLYQEIGLETDFKPVQVMELIESFYHVIKIKTDFLQRFLIDLSNLKTSKPIHMDSIAQLEEQFKCIQDFGVCINLEVVANRLSSSEVCIQ